MTVSISAYDLGKWNLQQEEQKSPIYILKESSLILVPLLFQESFLSLTRTGLLLLLTFNGM